MSQAPSLQEGPGKNCARSIPNKHYPAVKYIASGFTKIYFAFKTFAVFTDL